MKKISVVAVAALLTVSAVSTSHAIVGAGLHWGFDLSMGMEDVSNERVNLPFFDLSSLPVVGEYDLFQVSRANWRRSPVNFGGKVFINIIPFIETIELSCNFGMWQYDGTLLTADLLNFAQTGEMSYNETVLTLNNTGLSYIGLSGTPYAKLHFDATVRKTVLNLWLIKFSAGAGVSAHFATPLLSGSLIDDALRGVTLPGPDIFLAALADPNSDIAKDAAKRIVQEIIDEALGKPAFGAHILLGVTGKLPVIPVGVYIDARYMLPFSKFDRDAGSGINGFGLLLNMGISLSI
jgi:hypothetical protein